MQRRLERRSAILLAVFPSIAIGLLNGLYKESLFRAEPLWFWLADIAQFVLVPIVSLLLLWRVSALAPRDYGYVRIAGTNPWRALAFWTAVATFALLACYQGGVKLFAPLFGEATAAFGYEQTIGTRTWTRFVAVLYYAATAALVEETIYRGLPWLYFRLATPARHARWAYVVASSVLFSAIHWENGAHELAATGLVGVVACVLYLRIGSLWPLIGAHFLVDVISFWR